MKQKQLRWAERGALSINEAGYTRELSANLYSDLCGDSLRDFNRGSGGELSVAKRRCPKLHAVHSSAALACNVFEYWRVHDLSVIRRVLRLPAPIHEFRFEAQFPTGLDGEPPNLDVALELKNGSTCAIESKFTEPFCSPKSVTSVRAALKPKYFPRGQPLWTQRGLPACGKLAGRLRAGELVFRHLDAAQLLKHLLGLQNCRRSFALAYMWLDMDTDAGAKHRAEVTTFQSTIGGEVEFRSMSYQDFLARAHALVTPKHAGYFRYLRDRYL